MSASNSNLNESGFTFDLVTSMTQSALNSGLKDVLNATGNNYGPIIKYYKKENSDCTGNTVEMTPEEVQTYITDNNINMFSIPNGATTSDENPNEDLAKIFNITDICIVGGIRATMGTPASDPPNIMDVANAPNIIELQTNSTVDQNQTVLYDIYFKTFQATEILISRTCSCNQYFQTSDNPFQFKYMIDLNLDISQQNFNDLPDYMQTSIQNIMSDTSMMFSLQQLLLDLNTIEPYGTPETIVPADSPLGPVFDEFVTEYWTPMTQNGDIVFASSASPEDYPVSSIIPTSFNFMVSPYIDSSGSLSSDEKANLATLNYLVMTNSNPMPNPIQSFNWNWVDSGESISGIMAVKRDILVDSLNDLLSPLMDSLCYRVDAYSNVGNQNYLKLNAPTTTQKYTKINSNGEYLSFAYNSEDDDHSGFTDINNFIKGQVQVNSSIWLQNDQIKVVTQVTLYTEYDDGVSKTYGYPLAQKTTTIYQLQSVGSTVSDAGLLKLNLLSNNTDNLTQTTSKDDPYYNGDLDPSWWASFTTQGDVDEVIGDMLDAASDIQDQMGDNLSTIENKINNNYGFVFPGAKTYFFANPKFSESGDLTVEVAFQSVN